MKRILFGLILLLTILRVSASEPRVDYIIGSPSNNFIIAEVDTRTATHLYIKYYLDFYEVDGKQTATVWLSPQDEGNLLVHKFAININGMYYAKKSGTKNMITEGEWRGQNHGYLITDTLKYDKQFDGLQTDIVWITSYQPYMCRFLLRVADGYTNILIAKKEGLITGIDNVSTEKYEIARYNISGQMVDDTYKGVCIIKYNDGSTQKILKY